jgi:phosphinothricin acetyltransferase
MADDILLRPALLADAPAISAIYNHSVLTSTATYREEVEPVDERRQWLVEHVAPHVAIVAVDGGGTVVGWGSLSRFHVRSAYRQTAEDSIYLRADHCGRGLGGRILGHLVQTAGVNGLRNVVAVISADQAASIALHRRHGFVEAGLLRGIGCKFGRWLDVVYMQRWISGP